jgi:hypothetical protein
MRRNAASFESQFENWQIKHDPAEILFTKESEDDALKIELHKIGWRSEGKDPFKEMSERVLELFKLFLEPTGIKQIEKISARAGTFYPQDGNYEQLVGKLSKAFYNNYSEMQNLSADKATDAFFALNGIKNGYDNHVEFGPAKKAEVEKIHTAYGKNSKSESNIVIDAEVHIANSELDEAQDNVTALIAESKRLLDVYTDLIEKSL